ncbi:hypothetical protein [Nocardia lijiangensis]|uniref:hypothetical protein n=1 Tax=Nocardia lijiangensis TaxID=299618 RepID=UPI000AC25099|nr:hypothetical protein [Nocardia lijiangensis]
MNIRYAPLYVLAVTVLVTALVLAGLPVAILLLLQIAVACPLLVLVLIGSSGRDAAPRNRAAQHAHGG